MPVSDGYIEFVRDLLASFEPLRITRMFGGAGVYSEDVFFAILVDDVLYLKVDEQTRGAYESRGLVCRWRPEGVAKRRGCCSGSNRFPCADSAVEFADAVLAFRY